jgi:hypothetical protein
MKRGDFLARHRLRFAINKRASCVEGITASPSKSLKPKKAAAAAAVAKPPFALRRLFAQTRWRVF